MVTTRAAKRKSQAEEPEKTASPQRQSKKSKPSPTPQPTNSHTHKVRINRAPVLALWAAIVAERQGFEFDEGLTIGKWVSGVLAQSKGRSLGIYEAKEQTEQQRQARHKRDQRVGIHTVDAFGMKVPVLDVNGQHLAASEGKAVSVEAAKGYVERAFGDAYGDVCSAMRQLANNIPPEEIGKRGYHLYERFRPAWKGWGVKGELDLESVRDLAGHWTEI